MISKYFWGSQTPSPNTQQVLNIILQIIYASKIFNFVCMNQNQFLLTDISIKMFTNSIVKSILASASTHYSIIFTLQLIYTFLHFIYDSGHAKRVLTYWEKWANGGNHVHCRENISIVRMEKYIFFGKRETSSFQNYIVFHGYYGDIFLIEIMISPFFPVLY